METQQNETWLHLPDPFDKYEVSDMGRLRRHGSKRILNPCAGPDGYFRMPMVLRGGFKRTMYLHRLVAMMFCPGDQSLTVNHIDMVKGNNRAVNLEWITFSENHLKKFALRPELRKLIGERLSVPIIRRNPTNGSEWKYRSGKDAAIDMGHANRAGNISAAIKTGGKAYGFEWRYAEL